MIHATEVLSEIAGGEGQRRDQSTQWLAVPQGNQGLYRMEPAAGHVNQAAGVQ